MDGATLNGSRSNGSVFSKLRVLGFDFRLSVAVVILVLTTCQTKAETLSPPDLDLVYQQAHPASVIVGLPDEDIHESGAAIKRLSSFMPMRGRRGPDGVYSDNEDKRVSSFLPSRGKKDSDESVGSVADSAADGRKRASAFMAMRGRRLEGQGGTLYDTADELDEDYYKRAAFMPMRGRKSAFMPMRGRKWSPDSETKPYGLDLAEDKRASSFMPMRGRKKAFYGSKGGKKRLNAFMPMRGKKGSSEDEETLAADSQAPNETIRDESADELEMTRALQAAIATGPSEYNNLTSELDKRAQSFYGMRGKRHAPLLARAHKASGTVKREAVFIASRGKRSSDTKLDNDHSTNVAGQVRNANN